MYKTVSGVITQRNLLYFTNGQINKVADLDMYFYTGYPSINNIPKISIKPALRVNRRVLATDG